MAEGFTKRNGVHTLVWYEVHESMESAIAREKTNMEWKRAKKLESIEKGNLTWRDLYEEIVAWIPTFAGMTRRRTFAQNDQVRIHN